jgi:hypothetical protein
MNSKKSLSHVYILDFPQIDAIKVGKANDIFKRLGVLERHWGRANFNESYAIKTLQENVKFIETTIKSALHKYQIKGLEGDGKTEIFQKCGLEQALNILNVYIHDCDDEVVVTKGFKRPKPEHANQKKYLRGDEYKSNLLQKKVNDLIHSFEESSDRMIKAFRIISYLDKYKHKIKCKFDITEGNIKLKFRNNKYATIWIKLARLYFPIRLNDLVGVGDINLIDAPEISSDGLINVVISNRLIEISDSQSGYNLLSQLFLIQFKKALLELSKMDSYRHLDF